MKNKDNQPSKGLRPALQYEYLRLAREVLHFYENTPAQKHWHSAPHTRAGRLMGIGQPDTGSFNIALRRKREEMFWPNLLAIIPAVATGMGLALTGGTAGLPVWMMGAIFATLSLTGTYRYTQRCGLLAQIKTDFNPQDPPAFYRHIDRLETELAKRPATRLELLMNRLEDFTSFDVRERARSASHKTKPPAHEHNKHQLRVTRAFLQVARRMAVLAHNGQAHMAAHPRAELLSLAAKATYMEQFSRINLWPRLLFNMMKARQPLESVAPHFAAVPLAQEWFMRACCTGSKPHGFLKAYDALEERMLKQAQTPVNA